MRVRLLILVLVPLAANATSLANVTLVNGVAADCTSDRDCVALQKWCSAVRGTGQIVFAGLDPSGKGKQSDLFPISIAE